MTNSLALTVAHGATSRTERDTNVVNLESSTSQKPTSWEGPLLSVMRPTWVKVMESEQRIAWLQRMVDRKLCVKDLEAYVKLQHEQLRSENMKVKEEEREIILELMKVKTSPKNESFLRATQTSRF